MEDGLENHTNRVLDQEVHGGRSKLAFHWVDDLAVLPQTNEQKA